MANENKEDFVFGPLNYKLLIGGTIVIIIGYLLLMGGGSDDPDVFVGEEIFSFRRLTIAPLTMLIGFVVIIFAIMKKPKDENKES